MEKLVSVLQQFPLQERQYLDREGQNQVFASRGFVLSTGIDTFYAEMTGDYARSQAAVQFDPAVMHMAQMQTSVREYKDKEGNTRYSNEIRITKLI